MIDYLKHSCQRFRGSFQRPNRVDAASPEDTSRLRVLCKQYRLHAVQTQQKVTELEALLRVREAELRQLWAVVARDRERVKAESAALARQYVEAENNC